ncbi:hypothetical protein [Sulfurimonas sp.]|uniref:hypothetical protein n=1 Tax=Sulfurimonas sp. TaxID=2022749 RepID=UPI0025F98FAA|nr:hypothetical protein [Sulfurimonas sp.]
MKLYILNYSSFRNDLNTIDVKTELKTKYKIDTRRQDNFIHLGLFGALRLKDKINISIDDELYITSGIGNIDVFQKATHCANNKEFMKISDFINILGNSTSYYISKALGIKGKSLFQISDNFTYINTLISIYSSLYSSKKEAIFGSIDLVSQPNEILKRVLGLDEISEIVSSVNFQKLSLSSQDAIAEIEFDTQSYNSEEIKEILKVNDRIVYTSMRCLDLEFKKETNFFQTELSYTINKVIESREDMLYIDCFEDCYKVLRLKTLV